MIEAWKEALADRSKKGLLRQLSVNDPNTDALSLIGNDYLTLSRNQEVLKASARAASMYGTSSTGSPLVSGYTQIHSDLEDCLSKWYGGRPVLLWNTGYAANQSILSTYPQREDLVLADRLIHNSMITGILKSGATLKRYSHIDVQALESMLDEYQDRYGKIYVVTESVFSMDGDYPSLRKIAELKKQFGFHWVLDEAHAIGWYGGSGSGLAEENGVLDAVDVLVGTMGKGIGSMGAFTVFNHKEERDYFINFSGEFIYSTYLAPPSVGASLAAIQYIQKDSNREAYQELSNFFRNELRAYFPKLEVEDGESPIISVRIGDADKCMRVSAGLRAQGILVGAIRPPTVPKGTSRLRISLNSAITVEHVAHFIKALESVL